ncbi:MAG: hypothetical protein IPM64_13075 [Phycisphaerales bacterium]|nr:hypothetical protein [Phycisphaerales bacterium]
MKAIRIIAAAVGILIGGCGPAVEEPGSIELVTAVEVADALPAAADTEGSEPHAPSTLPAAELPNSAPGAAPTLSAGVVPAPEPLKPQPWKVYFMASRGASTGLYCADAPTGGNVALVREFPLMAWMLGAHDPTGTLIYAAEHIDDNGVPRVSVIVHRPGVSEHRVIAAAAPMAAVVTNDGRWLVIESANELFAQRVDGSESLRIGNGRDLSSGAADDDVYFTLLEHGVTDLGRARLTTREITRLNIVGEGTSSPSVNARRGLIASLGRSGLQRTFELRTLDGALIRQLGAGRMYDSDPRWSPAGDRIVFLSWDGAPALVVLDPDTGVERVLARNGMVAQSPCWSGDGSVVAMLSIHADRTREIVLTELESGSVARVSLPVDLVAHEGPLGLSSR